MDQWGQWATAAVTFLTGLGAIWATLRAIRRKDRAQDAQLGHQSAEEEEHGQENAAAQCWKFARQREKWYSDERKTFLIQLKTKDDLVEELRREIHGARNSWSEEQLKRLQLEETVKFLRAEVAELVRQERERVEREGQRDGTTPPPLSLEDPD